MIDLFTAESTGYHPVEEDDPEYKMEGGKVDRKGNPIFTLDQFRAGRAPYVTVAMDSSALPYGTTLISPNFPDVPFKVNDTGSAFKGKGLSRIDIARDNADGANHPENNGKFTFQIAGTPTEVTAPVQSVTPQQGIVPDMQGLSVGPSAVPEIPNSLSGIDMLTAVSPDEESYQGSDLLGQVPDVTQAQDPAPEPEATPEPQSLEEQTGSIKMLAIPSPNLRNLTKVNQSSDGKIITLTDGSSTYRWYPQKTGGDGHVEKDEGNAKLIWAKPGPKAEVVTNSPEKSKSGVPMQDPATGLNRRYRVNEKGEFVPIPIAGENEIPKPDYTLKGDDVIKNLSPEDQAFIKQTTGYHRAVTTGARGNPRDRRLYDYYYAYKPDFSEGEYPNVNKVRGQYANKSITAPGGQINSGNVLISQLGELQNYADKLDNKSFQFYNAPGNYLREKAGDPNISNFQGSRDAVISEFARYLTGGVPDDASKKRAEAYFSAASSPAQLKGMIQQVIPDTILPKLATLDYSYAEGTHGDKLPGGVLYPDSKKVLQGFGVKSPLMEGMTPSPPSPSKVDVPDAIEAAKRIMANPNSSPEAKSNAQKLLNGL